MIKRDSLKSWRFIAAFLIFLHHWPFYDPNPLLTSLNTKIFYALFSPVTFFFILSGWSLTSAYYEKFRNKTFNLKIYIKKRILRLYPIHFATFLLTLPLISGWLRQIPIQIAIANLLLVQAFFPAKTYLESFNGVSWSLSVFLFWYLLFPIVMVVIARFDWFIKKFAYIPMLLLIGGLAYWIHINEFDFNTPYALYYSPFERLIDCMTGVFLFFICKALGKRFSANTVLWTGIEIGAVLLLIATHWGAAYVPQKFLWDVYYILPWTVIIGVFSFSRGYLSAILSWKPLELLGGISLEFYLIHTLSLGWVYFFISQSFPMSTMQKGILSVLISIWGSVILHVLINVLFHRRLPRMT